MGLLVVVRHGQASLLEPNYDKLSPVGETQSRRLGEYWVKRHARFDQVFTGPCVRHIRTAEIVAKTYEQAGLPWPQPFMLNELDEYQAQEVLKQSLEELSNKHKHIRVLREAFHQSEGQPDAIRNFQKLFETVITMWLRGEFETPGVESWSAFEDRVRKGMSRILIGTDKGRRVAVFTSGGPISIAMQKALSLSPQKTMQLSWMMRNGAYCEFMFSGDRFSLSSFNAYPHLDDPALWTYW